MITRLFGTHAASRKFYRGSRPTPGLPWGIETQTQHRRTRHPLSRPFLPRRRPQATSSTTLSAQQGKGKKILPIILRNAQPPANPLGRSGALGHIPTEQAHSLGRISHTNPKKNGSVWVSPNGPWAGPSTRFPRHNIFTAPTNCRGAPTPTQTPSSAGPPMGFSLSPCRGADPVWTFPRLSINAAGPPGSAPRLPPVRAHLLGLADKLVPRANFFLSSFGSFFPLTVFGSTFRAGYRTRFLSHATFRLRSFFLIDDTILAVSFTGLAGRQVPRVNFFTFACLFFSFLAFRLAPKRLKHFLELGSVGNTHTHMDGRGYQKVWGSFTHTGSVHTDLGHCWASSYHMEFCLVFLTCLFGFWFLDTPLLFVVCNPGWRYPFICSALKACGLTLLGFVCLGLVWPWALGC